MRFCLCLLALASVALLAPSADACHGGGLFSRLKGGSSGCGSAQSTGSCSPATTAPRGIFRSAPGGCPGGVCPASLSVELSALASLTIDGSPTTSTGANRVFETPAYEPGTVLTYTLTARADGQVVTRSVTVRAGETTTVRIEMPTAVAGR